MSWYSKHCSSVEKMLSGLAIYKEIELRVFGSSLRSESPSDLDILVIVPDDDQNAKLSWSEEVKKLKGTDVDGIPFSLLVLRRCEVINPGKVIANIVSKSVPVFRDHLCQTDN